MLFLTHVIGSGRKVATAILYCSAVCAKHVEAGAPNPRDHTVTRLLAGARRLLRQTPNQRTPLTVEDLHSLCTGEDPPPSHVRDRAAILFGFASALRRSNIAALDLADIQLTTAGIYVQVKSEKNNQSGPPRTVAIPRKESVLCAVGAVERWLALRGLAPGPLFTRVHRGRHRAVTLHRLHPESIRLLVKRSLKRIGRDPAPYGAHSLRAGFVTAALSQGIGEVRVAAQTGHRSLNSLKGYYRPPDPMAVSAFRSLDL